ncbi:TPA: PTS transporter subunit EIIC [Streptococcus suis]|nr:PTS transporter subunit EIIC [Streptococcus suis]
MATKDYNQIARDVISAVGGKENIKQVLHCATRLRFNFINDKIDLDKLKSVNGVMGAMKVGEQTQVIIGTDVEKVFAEVSKELNFSNQDKGEYYVDENLDRKLTLKSIGSGILDGISGTMGPVIPAIVACAFFKMVTAILGPDMLKIISPDSNLYTLLSFVGDAAFYFFPVIIGYTAAKKFNVTPTLGILMGAVLIHPTLIQIVTEGKSFDVFGIPLYLSNYASSILPAILSVWVMGYVERFFNKNVPQSIRSVFAPAFTLLVMIPLSLCLLAPAGAFLGNYIVTGLLSLEGYVGFLGIAIIAALYPILVMTGMHMVLIMSLFQIFATQGWDGFSAPALCYASFSVMGVGIGAFFRLKNKDEKSLAASYAITALVAGTSEPTIYGICTKYKKPFYGLMAGGFVGGLYGGLTKVISATLVPSSSVTAVFAFLGRSNGNFINGIIASIISLVVAAVVTYLFGFDNDEPAVVGE